MSTVELPSPLPPSARKEQLEIYVADVDRLRQTATAANLMLKHEAELSRPASAQLGAILDELEKTLASLQGRRTVIIPKLRHEADKLDAAYNVAYPRREHQRGHSRLFPR